MRHLYLALKDDQGIEYETGASLEALMMKISEEHQGEESEEWQRWVTEAKMFLLAHDALDPTGP